MEGFVVKKIGKGAKVGLLIEMIAGIIMATLIIVSKPIPDFVAWIFMFGMLITLLSYLIEMRGFKK